MEEWRNPARATRGFQRVSAVPFASRQQRLGLSSKSEDEQCELGFGPEQRLSQHHGAFLPHQLLLVLIHELKRAPPSQRAGTSPPQHSHQRRDDILTTTNMTFKRKKKTGEIILRGKETERKRGKKQELDVTLGPGFLRNCRD